MYFFFLHKKITLIIKTGMLEGIEKDIACKDEEKGDWSSLLISGQALVRARKDTGDKGAEHRQSLKRNPQQF